jgi:hypothetical protein
MPVVTLDRVESHEAAGAFAPIGALAGQTAEWRRRSFASRDYDLLLGGRVFATLRIMGALRRWAELRAADGAWEIRRRGFWVPGLAIHRAGNDQPLAELDRTMMGHGTLQFATGARYQWQRVSLWGGRYEMTTDAGRTVLGIRGSTFRSRRSMMLDFASDAAGSRDLTVVAGVACFLRLMIARRAH